jgi:hypothetical protein
MGTIYFDLSVDGFLAGPNVCLEWLARNVPSFPARVAQTP